MENAVIVAAGRTAIGSFGGALSEIPAAQLGAKVIAGLLAKAGIKPDQVDEVIIGQVLTAGVGMNPARQAAIHAGLPDTVPAMTINKVCGSGLKAVALAAQAIRAGDAEIILAGGQENMSISPHLLPKSRVGNKMGDWAMKDHMINEGLTDVFNNYHMGVTAENIVKKYKFTREAQDRFAAASQQKAEAAQKAGRFDEEIIPIEIPQRKGDPLVFNKDEYPRAGTTAESLGKLKPAFDKEGTVTAGNASGINDGAAMCIVMSERKAKELGLTPLARIVAYASAGVDPKIMGTGPIPATRRCLEKASWKTGDLDLIEANEAFAAQAMSVDHDLGWDTSKVNVNGGAIALGHPLGATGAMLMGTALDELERSGKSIALVTLCIGAGMGTATIIERV